MACPMWVPLVENNESQNEGADYFIRKYIDQLLSKDPEIDTMILGCTHYPILLPKIQEYTPKHIRIVAQGEYVAESLKDYLSRHPEMNAKCTQNGSCLFLHHRGGREVCRIGLFLPEPANRRKKNFSRINMGKLINLSFFLLYLYT